MRDGSDRALSHGDDRTGPGRAPAPPPARGDPVHPMPGAGGGPSPQTEANDPRAAQLAGEKGPGQEKEAGGHGPAPPIADAGPGQGVEGDARCSAAAPLTVETDGSGSLATLQSSFSASSVVQGPAHDAAQARLLHGSPNWVKYCVILHGIIQNTITLYL